MKLALCRGPCLCKTMMPPELGRAAEGRQEYRETGWVFPLRSQLESYLFIYCGFESRSRAAEFAPLWLDLG